MQLIAGVVRAALWCVGVRRKIGGGNGWKRPRGTRRGGRRRPSIEACEVIEDERLADTLHADVKNIRKFGMIGACMSLCGAAVTHGASQCEVLTRCT
eukprot:2876517-Rhodomonas_salina.2